MLERLVLVALELVCCPICLLAYNIAISHLSLKKRGKGEEREGKGEGKGGDERLLWMRPYPLFGMQYLLIYHRREKGGENEGKQRGKGHSGFLPNLSQKERGRGREKEGMVELGGGGDKGRGIRNLQTSRASLRLVFSTYITTKVCACV